MIKLVNWYEEGLDRFYNDDNEGYIYGLYYYQDDEDYPIHVEWFLDEQTRANAL